MSQDQIILDPEDDSGSGEEPRLPLGQAGWIILAALIALLVISQVSASFNTRSNGHVLLFDAELKQDVRLSAQQKGGLFGGLTALNDDSASNPLGGLEKKIAPSRHSDALAQGLYAAVRTEEHKPISARDLNLLLASKKEPYRILGQIYGSKSLTIAQARTLISKLPTDGPFVYTLARVHALEKAGDKRARARYLQPMPVWKIVVLALMVLGVLGGFSLSWLTYLVGRSQGIMTPLGLRLGQISGALCDRLGARAAQLQFAFVALGTAFTLYQGKSLSSPVATFLQAGIWLVFVLWLFKTKVAGKPLTLADIGVTSDRLGENVLWGIGGFLAELPISIMLGVVGTKVFSFLPTPSHPAGSELDTNHSLIAFLSLLVFGAVVAPFWEEIMFRGLLFPGLTKILKSPIWGAVLSSLVFASIHPQGIPVWPALWAVAIMSCALNYQRRSLVPGMVMHAMHNLTLLAIGFLIG